MRPAAVRLTRRLLRPLGLDLVHADHPSTLTGCLKRLLPALGVNLVLDIGAHHGETVALLRGIGYRGWIVSFEADEDSHAEMARVCRGDPRWGSQNLALGAQAEMLMFHRVGSSDLYSFHDSTPRLAALAGAGWVRASGATRPMEVYPLDQLLPRVLVDLDLPQPRIFLKTDTQGHDAAVLAGATASLRHVVALQAELAVQPLYEDVPLFPANLTALTGLGFTLSGLFPVCHDATGTQVLEYDAVLRRPL